MNNIDVLRIAGCRCEVPLVGWRPNVGPRCRLCNVVAEVIISSNDWKCQFEGPEDYDRSWCDTFPACQEYGATCECTEGVNE